MILLKQLRRFLLTLSLVVVLTAGTFGIFGNAESVAATGLAAEISQLQTQIASMDRVEAGLKNIEGKTQEAIGNIMGNPKDQVAGRAKQLESQVRDTAIDINDQTQFTERAKAISENFAGKTQSTIGKATGNRSDQVMGKAKQGESQARHVLEDMKDQVRDFLN